VNGWQVKGKRSIFGHGGCGALRLHEAVRKGTDLLCESATSRYSRRKISTDDELSGLTGATVLLACIYVFIRSLDNIEHDRLSDSAIDKKAEL
jgi:hypothetical protein